MRTDKYNNSIYSEKDAVDLIYANKEHLLNRLSFDPDPEILKYNQHIEQKFQLFQEIVEDISVKEFDQLCQSVWFIPQHYQDLDIEQFIWSLIDADTVKQERVKEELDAFKSHNMLNVLKFLKYLVDYMRENHIVWGVGRGSSVASYVLYLLGIHKINSLKYNLDWREFLR